MEKCSTLQRLRKPKIADMSIFDWITSLLGAFILGKFIGIDSPSAWVLFILGWTLFGILAHWYFGISTMLGFYLGINQKPIRKECH